MKHIRLVFLERASATTHDMAFLYTSPGIRTCIKQTGDPRSSRIARIYLKNLEPPARIELATC